MIQVANPDCVSLEGVYLLDDEALQQLDRVLDAAEKEINKYRLTRIKSEAKKRVERRSESTKTPPNNMTEACKEAEEKLKSEYPHSIKKREVVVECASGKKFKARTFREVVESDDLDVELPEKATVEISGGDTTLSVTLFGFSTPIQFSIRPSDRIFRYKIIRQLSEWASQSRVPPLWDYISRYSFLPVVLVIACIFGFRLGITEVSTGRDELYQRARVLVEKGIDATNQAEAIEILLRLWTKDYQGTRISGVKSWYVGLVVLWLGWTTLSVVAPRSILGIGRAKKRLGFYGNVMKTTNYLIGGLLLAIVASAMGAWLFESLRASGN